MCIPCGARINQSVSRRAIALHARTTRMSFKVHQDFAAQAGQTLRWEEHMDFVWGKITEGFPFVIAGSRAGFNDWCNAFVDRKEDRIIKAKCMRQGMAGPYTFDWDGGDIILHYKMTLMEEGQQDQKIAMRAVGITPRTPGMIDRLQTMAQERCTAILYCGDGTECMPIAACGPWVLPDGRVITNHFGFAKHLVEHYKNPDAAERALEAAIAEESRKATAIMEEQIYPMLDDTELPREEAVVIKRHMNLCIRRRIPKMQVTVDAGARRYAQQTNMDTFCGDPTGIDPITLMILRQSCVLSHAANWVNRNCILPVQLSDFIPEIEIGACSNFVYQIPCRKGSFIVFKEQADQYQRRILAVIRRGSPLFVCRGAARTRGTCRAGKDGKGGS